MPVVDHATCVAGNINLTYAKVDDKTMVCAGYGGNSKVSVFASLSVPALKCQATNC